MDWCPRPERGTVVTIGEYDGVHRGHRAVISEMHRMAAERGCQTAVVTFDIHPAAIVRPESAPLLLTDLDQKLELLADTGVDYTLVVHFDEERSKEPAEQFVREVLIDCLRVKAVVVGADFHFGHQRRGNVALLERMGRELGWQVYGLPLVKQMTGDGDVISSTAIRMALGEGDVETAQRFLGRPFEVRGTVTVGDRRGRKIGFPTANVPIGTHLLMPADGVYAAWYERQDGTNYPAAVNIGKRPTFYEHADRSLIEAHLIGFRGDLYDETARIRFVSRLRGEQKFDGIEALAEQLKRDVEEAARLLRGG